MSVPILVGPARDGRADFDFYTGTWRVHNRRLKERLKGCVEWEEFDAVSVAHSILGGLGNADELTMNRDGNTVIGYTLRLYEPATHVWRLYWTSSLSSGALDIPMVGAFDDDHVGHFYAQEVFAQTSIISRFIWSGITASTARWEQAFSPDGGATWETNWIMESTRVE